MRVTALIRSASITALLAATAGGLLSATAAGGGRPHSASADAPSVVTVAASDTSSQFVPLGVGKSVVIDLPRDIKDVLVADPTIANAVVRSTRRAYLIGVKPGQTNVFFFDAEGHQIAGVDIAVTRDLNGARAALRALLPDGDIHIEGVGDGVVLSGTVSSQTESQQAYDLAVRLVGDPLKVANAITVRGRDQVLLKVTVAEVERDVVKQLGINLNGNLQLNTSVLNFTNNNPFSAFGSSLSGSSIAGTWAGTTATLQAMDRAGVIHTLAEPSLTAISGESATFVAGGQFPVPSGLTCSTTTNPPVCQPQITFMKFGVSMSFTPVVLAEGRISLKVLTEVSDLTNENAITLQFPGSSQPLTIPAIRSRRADATVEIPSGGVLAMAGMIQESTKQQINGLPGLMQLPVLGALFRSRDYINQQTELVVLVTPYVVHPVARKDLSKPDDGFADASDPSTLLLGRLNRIYGVAGGDESKGTYHGNYGFILD
jgi:pilus assembly protein CpaC